MATWTGGGGADTNWSNADNWGGTPLTNGDSVYFNGVESSHNDIADIQISSISIDTGSVNFYLDGLRIQLTGSISASGDGDSGRSASLNTPFDLSGSISVSQGSQFCNISLSGVLTGSGSLSLGAYCNVGDSSGTSTYSGTISLDGSDANVGGIYPNANFVVNSGSNTRIISYYGGVLLGSITGNADFSLGSVLPLMELRGGLNCVSALYVNADFLTLSAGYGHPTATVGWDLIVAYGGVLTSDRTITASTLYASYAGVVQPGTDTVGGTLTCIGNVNFAYVDSELRLRLHGNGSSANSKLVCGPLGLQGNKLTIAEYLEPTTGSVFTIVEASSIGGLEVFDVGPDGTVFTQAGRSLRINYTATTVTLTDLGPSAGSTRTWTGGGTTNNWSDAGNWDTGVPGDGDSVVFAGTTRLSPVNNLTPGLNITDISFASGAGAFSISGNSIVLNGSISADAVNTSIGLDITLDAVRDFNCNTSGLSITGVLSGVGGIQKTGSATLNLWGVNTYTGSTTVASGTLSLSSSGSITDTSEIILTAGDSILDFNGSTADQTYAMSITGSGGIHMYAGGVTVTLTGAGNTYSGATVIDNGTLQSGDGGTTGGIANTSSVSGSGTIAFNRSDNIQQGMAVPSVLTGAINVVQKGASDLTLSQMNDYTGTTTVQSGTLTVTGSIASPQVFLAAGTALRGNGVITGSIIPASGATIAPDTGSGGSGIGSLTTGDVGFVPGSVFSVDLDGSGPAADRIVAANGFGEVGCNSATLTVASITASFTGAVYTIVTATTVSGTFNGLADGDTFMVSGRKLRINYTSGSVTLTDVPDVVPIDYPITGGIEPVALMDNGPAANRFIEGSITSVAEALALFGRELLPDAGITTAAVYGVAIPANFPISGGAVSPASVAGVVAVVVNFGAGAIGHAVCGVSFHIPYAFSGGIITAAQVAISYSIARVSASSKEAEYEKTGYRSMFGLLIYAMNCEAMSDIVAVPNGGSFLVSHTFMGGPGDPFHDYGAGPDYIGTKVVDATGAYLVFRPPVPNEAVWVVDDPEAPL